MIGYAHIIRPMIRAIAAVAVFARDFKVYLFVFRRISQIQYAAKMLNARNGIRIVFYVKMGAFVIRQFMFRADLVYIIGQIFFIRLITAGTCTAARIAAFSKYAAKTITIFLSAAASPIPGRILFAFFRLRRFRTEADSLCVSGFSKKTRSLRFVQD